jgi:hypothetical protein
MFVTKKKINIQTFAILTFSKFAKNIKNQLYKDCSLHLIPAFGELTPSIISKHFLLKL